MAEYIKVGGTEYAANTVYRYQDRSWDMRETKTVYLKMTHDEAAALLADNTAWSIVQRDTVEKLDADGNATGETEEVASEYDNSEYSMSGDITDYRDGTVSVKMGKPTEEEKMSAQLSELEAAYDEQ